MPTPPNEPLRFRTILLPASNRGLRLPILSPRTNTAAVFVAVFLLLSTGCWNSPEDALGGTGDSVKEEQASDEETPAQDPASQEDPHCLTNGCPNILLIVSDDQGWDDVGYHGSWIETPNIDSIADNGVQLERFYVNAICNPTRAALMTGRSAIDLGTQYSQGTLPGDEYTIAERFRDAGYDTGIIGKWSLGARSPQLPNDQGFDYFYGHLQALINYFSHDYIAGPDWWRNRDLIDEPGYTTTLLGSEAVRFINERDPSNPFFLTLSFNAPHSPIQIPSWAKLKYRQPICIVSTCFTRCSISGEQRCDFARMVELMDTQIGAVLDTLDQRESRTTPS